MTVKTPPMGWNTWNTFGEKINEQLIIESVDKFLELGLKDAGYEYIVIDDCWSKRERDPKTNEIVADPEKFPHGMKYLADYIHSKGLKFGMYSCAGVRTCADYPSSYGHEFLDARTFAKFGVDFLKYDYCNVPINNHAPLLYRRMGQALRNCGRDILFSACNWGVEDVWSWIRSTGAGMYRSTGDIFDNFKSMRDIAVGQLPKMCYSAPGCFNDMDMLTVGMFGNGNVGSGTTGCNLEQYKIQFALWCIMGSPLMLGCDIRKMTPEILSLVKNRELIAFNQDPLAAQAYPACNSWGSEDIFVMAKLLDGKDFVLMFTNLSERDMNQNLLLEKIGIPYESGLRVEMTDCFSGEKIMSGRDGVGCFTPKQSARVFRCKAVDA